MAAETTSTAAADPKVAAGPEPCDLCGGRAEHYLLCALEPFRGTRLCGRCAGLLAQKIEARQATHGLSAVVPRLRLEEALAQTKNEVLLARAAGEAAP